MHFDVEEAARLIRDRRSIFPAQYTGARVDDEIVMNILESANWAPTHKYTEPWRFIVFTDYGLRRLIDAMIRIYRETTAPENISQRKLEKLAKLPGQVSHIIAICMKRSPDAVIPEIEEIAAVACAVQNIYLMVNAYGLGGYWSTGSGTFTIQMKSFLELGEHDKCMGFFYLGHYDGRRPPGKARGPIAEKVKWNFE